MFGLLGTACGLRSGSHRTDCLYGTNRECFPILATSLCLSLTQTLTASLSCTGYTVPPATMVKYSWESTVRANIIFFKFIYVIFSCMEQLRQQTCHCIGFHVTNESFLHQNYAKEERIIHCLSYQLLVYKA